jgi:pyruvate dehydrogenase E1 component beta subunit
MQAIDHIINSAAKTRYMSGGLLSIPIVFRGPNGFASRVAAQHSQCYASWYGHVPGMRVVAPYSAADAKGLLKSAIRDPNPVVFLEQELLYGRKFEVPKLDDYTVPIGKAKVVREGKDVTLISFSYTMIATLDAADMLAEQGIEAEVIDLRTIRPLDMDTLIQSVKKTNRAVVIEQGWVAFGVTAEVSSMLMEQAFDWLDAPVLRLGGEDVPMPYAANLEQLAIVQPEDVVKAAKTVCYKD